MLEDAKAKRKLDLVLESSSDSDSDSDKDQIICDDSSDILMCSKQGDQGDENESVKDPKLEELKEGDYVLVKFDWKKKKNTQYYIGQVESIDIENSTIDALFLKRKPSKHGQILFYFQEKVDASEVPLTDVLYKLPNPSSGGTKHTGNIFTFKTGVIEDGEYNVL